VSWLAGNGDGSLGARTGFGTSAAPLARAWGLAIADLDGDGALDAAVTNRDAGSVRVLRGRTITLAVPAPAPRGLSLSSPSPNPTSGATEVRLLLAAPTVVAAEIFDLAGRRVQTLHAAHLERAGSLTLRWDARDSRGRRVEAGVYLIAVHAADGAVVRRVAVLR
jgi:hypothetical protein